MKDKIVICLILFLCFSGVSHAFNGDHGHSGDTPKPRLEIGSHPNWKADNVFEEGRSSISSASLYALTLKALLGNLTVEKFTVNILLENIGPLDLTNYRLMIDENENGLIDKEEKQAVGGAGALQLLQSQAVVVFPEPINLAKNRRLHLILLADIARARIFASLTLNLDTKNIVVKNADGDSAMVSRVGILPEVAHLLDYLLIALDFKLVKEQIVGNKVQIEGYIQYRHLSRIDIKETKKLESLEILRSNGWEVGQIRIGRRIGVSKYKRFVSLTLYLPPDIPSGKYQIPSFPVYYWDRLGEKEKLKRIFTPEFTVEKVDYLIQTDYFPKVINIGGRIKRSIVLQGPKDCGIPSEFITSLKRQKTMGAFSLEEVTVFQIDRDADREVRLELDLSYFDQTGVTVEIPEMEFLFLLSADDESEVKTHTVPARQVRVDSLFLEGEDMFLKPVVDCGATLRGWHSDTKRRKTLFIVLIALSAVWVVYPPARWALRKFKKGEPLFWRFRRRCALEQAQFRFRETANIKTLRRLLLSLESYLRTVLLGETMIVSRVSLGMKFAQKDKRLGSLWQGLYDDFYKLTEVSDEIISPEDKQELIEKVSAVVQRLEIFKKKK